GSFFHERTRSMPEPNISGLGGGTPDPDEPFASSGQAPASILGATQLQASVDKFQRTVDKLDQLYQRVSRGTDAGGLPGTGRRGPGGSGGNAGAPSFGGSVADLVHHHASGIYSAATGRSLPSSFHPRSWSGGGNGGGFIGQYTFGGAPMGGAGLTAPAGGGAGNGGGATFGGMVG